MLVWEGASGQAITKQNKSLYSLCLTHVTHTILLIVMMFFTEDHLRMNSAIMLGTVTGISDAYCSEQLLIKWPKPGRSKNQLQQII